MSLFDTIKQSGLQATLRVFGTCTLVTDTGSDGQLHVYFSNGDSVLATELGEREIDTLQAKLGLNNRQGVLSLIAAALKDLQPPAASLTQGLVVPLARGSPREAELRLQQPANQGEARRRVFSLVSAHASDLAAQLESANRALEAARSCGGSDAGLLLGKRLGAVAPGSGAGAGKRVARTALPGMSLVNPMQRKRKVARGVVFADDEEEGESSDSGKSDDKDKKRRGKRK